MLGLKVLNGTSLYRRKERFLLISDDVLWALDLFI